MFGSHHSEAEAHYREFKEAEGRGHHKDHPLAAGAAAFAAMELYNAHRENNNQAGLSKMQEIMISAAVGGIDKMVEDKVIPFAKRESEKRKAAEHVKKLVEERFVEEDTVNVY